MEYTITYNIFNFNEEEPDAWVYDVANCFMDEQKSNVQFYLQGNQSEAIEFHRKEFRYWLFLSITGYIGISPIRISGLDVSGFRYVCALLCRDNTCVCFIA